ncbi:hypothetical protein QYE76_050002 [Lolium multiflorum]|uniref:F-box domain-containing protein n=1 Tax=Lolium multiflorum TaxID=4521 RepID=A0AAD8SP25_LOLMU|nr:hypothetical protein QYE76_050002 [Lolium multiflorum]
MEPSSKRVHADVDQSMEPPSKRIRVAADDDRLSDLPDCLIHTILSFLNSRQVVRTSVLSRRWRHLWRSVPCIDIDFTLFRRRHHARCQARNCCRTEYGQKKVCKKEWQPFEKFSDNLLLLHNAPSLDKLRIHVPDLDFQDKQAIRPCLRWISKGVQCSPTMIDIHMDFYWSFNNWCPYNDYGPFPDLGSRSSRLTKLFLHGVKLDDSFAEQLRSGSRTAELALCSRSSMERGKVKEGKGKEAAVEETQLAASSAGGAAQI